MKLKYQAALLALALSLGACQSDELFDSENTPEGAMGKVYRPGVKVSSVDNVESKASDSRAGSTVDVSNYLLDFYRAGDTEAYLSGSYSELGSVVELPAGDYTVSVRSHNVAKAEWDRPYYTGESTQFTVVAGEIATVDPITCVFSSIKVTVEFTDKMLAVLGDDVQVTVEVIDEGALTFTPSTTLAGYFEAVDGSTTMVATLTGTVDGRQETEISTFDDIAKGQYRRIIYSLGGELPTPDEPSGSIDLGGITIDFSYTDEDLDGEIDPGKEEVIDDGEDSPYSLPEIEDPDDSDDPADDPTTDPDTPDTPSDPITFSGTIANGGQYYTSDFVDDNDNVIKAAQVIIVCANGCKDILVDIDSTTLTDEILSSCGLAASFSLANDTQFFEGLRGLGLPCGDEVVDQTGEINFDISDFMPLLGIYGTAQSKFTLTVTDNAGNVEKCVFNIDVK